MMFPVQKMDTLAKVTTYELRRDGLPLQIRIYYVLRGNNEGKYVACIFAHDIDIAHQWAVCDSEQAALRETLEKILPLTRKQVVLHG